MGTQEQVNEIIRGFFNNPKLQVSAATTAADVPGWDSLAHSTLMMEIERAFDIEFDLDDILEFANVGEIVAKIDKLRSA